MVALDGPSDSQPLTGLASRLGRELAHERDDRPPFGGVELPGVVEKIQKARIVAQSRRRLHETGIGIRARRPIFDSLPAFGAKPLGGTAGLGNQHADRKSEGSVETLGDIRTREPSASTLELAQVRGRNGGALGGLSDGEPKRRPRVAKLVR